MTEKLVTPSEEEKVCECKCPCDCEVKPEPKPVPEPEDKGRVKDWGSKDNNPHNWKVVNMKDDPTKFKVVDKDNVNRADNFNAKAGAEKFIADAIANYKPEVEPEPQPQPNVEGNVVEGVVIPYEVTGKVRTNPFWNKRDDGLRLDFEDNKGVDYVNSVQVFYGSFKGNVPDDEITFKWSWGRHSKKGDIVKAYGIGLNNKTGATRGRMEWEHPSYSKNKAEGKKGLPIKKGVIYGYMGVRKTLPNGNVLLEYWQDQGGLVDGKPANKWVKLLTWEDSEYKVTDYSKNGCEPTTRIDDDNGGHKNVDVKFSMCVEIK